MQNLLLNTDSYKFSHYLFYPENTTEVYSYAESRGGKYDKTVFLGLYSFIQQYLMKPITMTDVLEANTFAEKHGVPFNLEGWEYIVKEHSGRLPIEIRAVPEGSVIPTQNVLATVRNTDPNCAWLTSYIETALLRIWYPTTVATRIYYMKKKMLPYFERTADNLDMSFALLDFSSRGCSSLETSKIGGMAYLTMFMGSDNVPAVDYTNKLYGVDMSGFSVPATEHSIMTAYGQKNEKASLERILRQAPEGGIISIVGDTWNIYENIDMLAELQYIVKERNLTLVIRPDSGSMTDVLPKIYQKVIDRFPFEMNSKGYKVFDNVKILWGDGINEDTCEMPFLLAEQYNISAECIMIGSGGGLMQANIDRDTCKFAFKASNVIVDGESREIFKDPITGPGKKSKKGKFKLVKVNNKDLGGYQTVRAVAGGDDELVTYYKDGIYYYKPTLQEIRERISLQLK